MTMKASVKTKNPLDNRVPKSEKYKHITGRLDTGLTLNKVKVITVREFSRRRDEIYFRITNDMLDALYEEYEQHENDESMGHMERLATSGGRMGMGGGGAGGGPTIITHEDSAQAVYDRPYLLLDVREEAEYRHGHLLQAKSFPHQLLRRDQLHPEIYKFKNKPEQLIIVYCDKEDVSRDAAKILVDRGIDNIFLLTGGMHEMAHKFPQSVEGNQPNLPVSPNRAPSRKCRDHREELERLKESARNGGRSRLDTISEAGTFDHRGNPVYKDEEYKEEYGRAPYSLSTARSPVVSDRVARALSERRTSRQGSESASDFGGGGGGGGGGRGSSSGLNGNGALNSARLREHTVRAELDARVKSSGYTGGSSSRGGGGGGGGEGERASHRGSPQRGEGKYNGERERERERGREDGGYSEAGFSVRSNRSVAESIMSKAMGRKGKY